MFFLVRCAFWLGLVFLNMDWKVDGPILPTGEEFARQLTAHCIANPQICNQVMQGAQQLVVANVESKAAPVEIAEPAAVPVPLPAPSPAAAKHEAKPAQKVAARH